MDDDLPLYTVRPRAGGRGYRLEGPLLPWALRFQTGADAYRHAVHQMSPHRGAKIEVYDPQGRLYFTRTIAPKTTWLSVR